MAQAYTKESFTMFSDPGHAWLKVSFLDIDRVGLGITVDFSGYSYYQWDKTYSEGYVYLEEDIDIAIFLAAYYGKHKAMPLIARVDSDQESEIRKLKRLPQGKAFEANIKAAMAILRESEAA